MIWSISCWFFLKCFFSNYWTFVLFVMNIFTIPLIQTCFCSVVFYPLKYRKETEEINTLLVPLYVRYNLSSTFMSSLVNHSLALALWCLMALSLIFQLYWWGKAEDPEKTTNHVYKLPCLIKAYVFTWAVVVVIVCTMVVGFTTTYAISTYHH
jgi:hypothetical protein